jgi:hypothetical protein
LLDEAPVDPAGLGERRQQQGVQPDGEAAKQTGDGAGMGPLLPVHAAEHRRCELRDGGKGNQPDADQRIGLAGRPEINVAEQKDDDDGGAPDAEKYPRKSRRSLIPNHCARSTKGMTRSLQTIVDKRDGLDDDHAGRRRQTTDEDQQGQRLGTTRQRQGQHEGIWD